jgi:hypothetical protein
MVVTFFSTPPTPLPSTLFALSTLIFFFQNISNTINYAAPLASLDTSTSAECLTMRLGGSFSVP